MTNPIWITVDDGDTFVGHQAHWADCFFSNSTRSQIEGFCEAEGWKCDIREMTDDEVAQYPYIHDFVNGLIAQYGEA